MDMSIADGETSTISILPFASRRLSGCGCWVKCYLTLSQQPKKNWYFFTNIPCGTFDIPPLQHAILMMYGIASSDRSKAPIASFSGKCTWKKNACKSSRDSLSQIELPTILLQCQMVSLLFAHYMIKFWRAVFQFFSDIVHYSFQFHFNNLLLCS